MATKARQAIAVVILALLVVVGIATRFAASHEVAYYLEGKRLMQQANESAVRQGEEAMRMVGEMQ